MKTKVTIRVAPDNEITIRVEGLTEEDKKQPKGKKKCDRITQRLERDLGSVTERIYCDDHEGQEGTIDLMNSDEDILSQDG